MFEPRERQVYQGQGDARRVVGRFTDADGRPLSAVPAVVVAEPLGMLGDATVLLPDMQAAGLDMGAVVRVEGNTTARLAGGDLAAIRASITGERVDAARGVPGVGYAGRSSQGRRRKAA